MFCGILPKGWGRGPRRGNLGPEKQRGFSRSHDSSWQSGLGALASCGNSRLKTWVRDLVPLGPNAHSHFHQTSWPIPSAASGEACWVCKFSRILEPNGLYFILRRVNYIIPFSHHFFPVPGIYIVNRLFKSKDLTREYKNIPRPTEMYKPEVENL